MANEIKTPRDRKFRLLLYPEDPTHSAAIKKLEADGYQFAAILHTEDVWEDGDEDIGNNKPGDKKKPHWHVVVKFPHPRYKTGLATELGIKSNYVKDCKSFDQAMKYLVHEGWPDKYQYDPDVVFGSLKSNLLQLLTDKGDEGSRVKEIINIIDLHQGKLSIRTALIKVADNGLYGEFRRMGIFAKAIIDEHNAEVVELDRIATMRAEELDEFQQYIKWRERFVAAGHNVI